MPSRTLVIPMHQESARIEGTLRTIAGAWESFGDCELVLVDDGSGDDTADVAERTIGALALPGRVVRLVRNGGKGNAIAAGVAVAGGGSIAFTDADLSAPPAAIVRCFEVVEAGDVDVVVTSRHLPESAVDVRPPIARRSSSAAFRRVARWAGVRDVSDSQCGLKAFRADAARVLFRDLSVQRFAFDVEVLLRADLAGLRVVELPIAWRHVDSSTVRTVRDGARMMVDVVRLRGRLRGWSPDGHLPVAALLEREHWWYVAGRDAVLDAARRAGAKGSAIDLDAQTGATLEALDRDGWDPALGVSAGAPAARFAASRKLPVVAAGVSRLPHRAGAAGLVVASDVLQRLDDDVAAMREAARVLRPGGVVVVTVPADPSKWSHYDVVLGHRRRYSADDVRRLLDCGGFEVIDVRRLHSWLAPVSFVLAKTPLRAVLLRDAEQSTFVHRRVNALLRAVGDVERRVAARVRLPVGQAFVAVGAKR